MIFLKRKQWEVSCDFLIFCLEANSRFWHKEQNQNLVAYLNWGDTDWDAGKWRWLKFVKNWEGPQGKSFRNLYKVPLEWYINTHVHEITLCKEGMKQEYLSNRSWANPRGGMEFKTQQVRKERICRIMGYSAEISRQVCIRVNSIIDVHKV